MSVALVLQKVPDGSTSYDEIMFHAMFQSLVDFIEQKKGYTPDISSIKNWVYDGLSSPHPFQLAYASASFFSRVVYKNRWRKLLAQANLYHEIQALTRPDAPPEDLAYAHLVNLQQELYLWYLNDYKGGTTDVKIMDEKLSLLLSIRHTLWS